MRIRLFSTLNASLQTTLLGDGLLVESLPFYEENVNGNLTTRYTVHVLGFTDGQIDPSKSTTFNSSDRELSLLYSESEIPNHTNTLADEVFIIERDAAENRRLKIRNPNGGDGYQSTQLNSAVVLAGDGAQLVVSAAVISSFEDADFNPAGPTVNDLNLKSRLKYLSIERLFEQLAYQTTGGGGGSGGLDREQVVALITADLNGKANTNLGNVVNNLTPAAQDAFKTKLNITDTVFDDTGLINRIAREETNRAEEDTAIRALITTTATNIRAEATNRATAVDTALAGKADRDLQNLATLSSTEQANVRSAIGAAAPGEGGMGGDSEPLGKTILAEHAPIALGTAQVTINDSDGNAVVIENEREYEIIVYMLSGNRDDGYAYIQVSGTQLRNTADGVVNFGLRENRYVTATVNTDNELRLALQNASGLAGNAYVRVARIDQVAGTMEPVEPVDASLSEEDRARLDSLLVDTGHINAAQWNTNDVSQIFKREITDNAGFRQEWVSSHTQLRGAQGSPFKFPYQHVVGESNTNPERLNSMAYTAAVTALSQLPTEVAEGLGLNHVDNILHYLRINNSHNATAKVYFIAEDTGEASSDYDNITVGTQSTNEYRNSDTVGRISKVFIIFKNPTATDLGYFDFDWVNIQDGMALALKLNAAGTAYEVDTSTDNFADTLTSKVALNERYPIKADVEHIHILLDRLGTSSEQKIQVGARPPERYSTSGTPAPMKSALRQGFGAHPLLTNFSNLWQIGNSTVNPPFDATNISAVFNGEQLSFFALLGLGLGTTASYLVYFPRNLLAVSDTPDEIDVTIDGVTYTAVRSGDAFTDDNTARNTNGNLIATLSRLTYDLSGDPLPITGEITNITARGGGVSLSLPGSAVFQALDFSPGTFYFETDADGNYIALWRNDSAVVGVPNWSRKIDFTASGGGGGLTQDQVNGLINTALGNLSLEDLDNVPTQGTEGQYLTPDMEGNLEWRDLPANEGENGGASDFLGLSDTPASYPLNGNGLIPQINNDRLVFSDDVPNRLRDLGTRLSQAREYGFYDPNGGEDISASLPGTGSGILGVIGSTHFGDNKITGLELESGSQHVTSIRNAPNGLRVEFDSAAGASHQWAEAAIIGINPNELWFLVNTNASTPNGTPLELTNNPSDSSFGTRPDEIILSVAKGRGSFTYVPEGAPVIITIQTRSETTGRDISARYVKYVPQVATNTLSELDFKIGFSNIEFTRANQVDDDPNTVDTNQPAFQLVPNALTRGVEYANTDAIDAPEGTIYRQISPEHDRIIRLWSKDRRGAWVNDFLPAVHEIEGGPDDERGAFAVDGTGVSYVFSEGSMAGDGLSTDRVYGNFAEGHIAVTDEGASEAGIFIFLPNALLFAPQGGLRTNAEPSDVPSRIQFNNTVYTDADATINSDLRTYVNGVEVIGAYTWTTISGSGDIPTGRSINFSSSADGSRYAFTPESYEVTDYAEGDLLVNRSTKEIWVILDGVANPIAPQGIEALRLVENLYELLGYTTLNFKKTSYRSFSVGYREPNEFIGSPHTIVSGVSENYFINNEGVVFRKSDNAIVGWFNRTVGGLEHRAFAYLHEFQDGTDTILVTSSHTSVIAASKVIRARAVRLAAEPTTYTLAQIRNGEGEFTSINSGPVTYFADGGQNASEIVARGYEITAGLLVSKNTTNAEIPVSVAFISGISDSSPYKLQTWRLNLTSNEFQNVTQTPDDLPMTIGEGAITGMVTDFSNTNEVENTSFISFIRHQTLFKRNIRLIGVGNLTKPDITGPESAQLPSVYGGSSFGLATERVTNFDFDNIDTSGQIVAERNGVPIHLGLYRDSGGRMALSIEGVWTVDQLPSSIILQQGDTTFTFTPPNSVSTDTLTLDDGTQVTASYVRYAPDAEGWLVANTAVTSLSATGGELALALTGSSLNSFRAKVTTAQTADGLYTEYDSEGGLNNFDVSDPTGIYHYSNTSVIEQITTNKDKSESNERRIEVLENASPSGGDSAFEEMGFSNTQFNAGVWRSFELSRALTADDDNKILYIYTSNDADTPQWEGSPPIPVMDFRAAPANDTGSTPGTQWAWKTKRTGTALGLFSHSSVRACRGSDSNGNTVLRLAQAHNTVIRRVRVLIK